MVFSSIISAAAVIFLKTSVLCFVGGTEASWLLRFTLDWAVQVWARAGRGHGIHFLCKTLETAATQRTKTNQMVEPNYYLRFDCFLQNKFCSCSLCIFLLIFFSKQRFRSLLNAFDCEIHHAVLGKNYCAHSLSQQLYFLEFELLFWVMSVFKWHLHWNSNHFFSTFFYQTLSIHVNSLRQKKKMMTP